MELRMKMTFAVAVAAVGWAVLRRARPARYAGWHADDLFRD